MTGSDAISIISRRAEMKSKQQIEAMEKELTRLVSFRESAVGIDLKRTNCKIAELQNRIDHAKRGAK